MNTPEQNNSPVPLLPPGCEADFTVSPTVPAGWDRPTRFTDLVWQLPPTSSSPNQLGFTRINWRFDLPDGSLISAPANATLLHTMKCALWAMLSPLKTNSNGSSAGVMARFHHLRRFMRWLNSEHFRSLAELTQSDLDRYVTYIKSCELSRGSMVLYLGAIRVLARYGDLIPNNFCCDPFSGKSPHTLVDYKPRRDLPIPLPLSDKLVAALYPMAWKWVDQYATAIVEAKKTCETLTFHDWHAKVLPKLELKAKDGTVFRSMGTTTKGDLEHLAKKLQAACYVLIAGFSGCRFHEVAFAPKTSIPQFTKSADGALEVWTWQSKTFKIEGTLHGRERTWVIGGRPVGEDTEIWSVVAVRKLIDLNEAFRVSGDQLFFKPHSRVPIDNVEISSWLRLFVEEELPDLRAEKIRTHQFRRTFARWCVRFEEAGDSAIIQQFGHLYNNWLMGYVGRDVDLSAMFGIERAAQVSDQLTAMMTQPIAGPAADEILKERAELLATIKSEKDFVEMIASMAKRKDIKLEPTHWGVCYYSKEKSQCGGDASGPNKENRNPSICAGCKNLRVLPQHRAFHVHRIATAERMLEVYPKAAKFLRDDWTKSRDQSREFVAQLDAQAGKGAA